MSATGGATPSPQPRSEGTAVGEPATFGRRFAAVTVDWLLSLGVAVLIAQGWPPPGLLVSAMFFLEYTFFTGLYGQTPGMRLLGLACVRVDDGRPLGLPRAAQRALLLNLVVPAVIFDRDGRGLHDRAGGSVVVRA
ncbi:MAG: hypothetical protein QOC93_2154 [Actinomycetota bacterium]|jgi:uncharacterized RDD family membrane protein YckC|nr:hypothetical protein [Actinomycetota bacterium]